MVDKERHLAKLAANRGHRIAEIHLSLPGPMRQLYKNLLTALGQLPNHILHNHVSTAKILRP
jgi:hypothetical protein